MFGPIRRAVVFLLGVAVIIDSFFESSHRVGQLIIGLILVGVLPVDEFVLIAVKKRQR